MTDDPKFYAWLDGELSGAEAAAMDRRVAADPELRSLADQHRALQARLGAAFAPVAVAPLPNRIREAAVLREAEVVSLDAVRERRSRSWIMQGAAMAASLALGLFAGATMLAPETSLKSRDGQIVAAGKLDDALSTQLVSTGSIGDIRIGLSFKAANGNYCRSFTEGGSAGLACRERGSWRVQGLFSAGEGQSSDYRMAAGQDPRLMALVEGAMIGEPLDAEAELIAAQRGWSP